MTRDQLLAKLREPSYCYVRATRFYYDGSGCFDQDILTHKGMLIAAVRAAPSLSVFNVEITPRGTGYRSYQRIIIKSCIGQPGRNP